MLRTIVARRARMAQRAVTSVRTGVDVGTRAVVVARFQYRTEFRFDVVALGTAAWVNKTKNGRGRDGTKI